MNEVNKKTNLMLTAALMLGAWSTGLLSSIHSATQPPRPSKTQNNDLLLKAEAKRKRKMERNKAAL